ncbi:ZIP family zinc transporter [Citricoccus sp. SGAir0253]|uniref:ZIP family metal transporter n=1 Tax=Citricoccus sp. SGAir0253 TaxID=2567881 RepID=UPI0010CD44E3|nr:ZIP family zinc transporter [Citricoccus sp. SGAir0253]QCU77172.1 ZIP family zinc transporter [Citricoccus sp. SGAir0253]
MTGMLTAAGWGLFAGAALLVGAAVAWFIRVPPKVVGSVMAFGSGVLVSAVAFELFEEAARTGGLWSAVLGFAGGAAAYMLANMVLARYGARHRKRSQDQQPSRGEQSGSGLAIALGALLDGIPESLVLGISLLGGGGVSAAVVAAVFISNLPEGLSSAAGMKKAGRGAGYVFGVWGTIALVSAVSAGAGYLLLGSAPDGVIGAITAIAGGAILTMIADTMIPEAFEITHAWTGLITSGGFLLAAAISWLG